MLQHFQAYLAGLRETALRDQTEHSGRTYLQLLLKAAAAEYGAPGMKVLQEPRRDQEKGAPDFRISLHGSIVGYLENKPVGENLDRVLKSDQIARYRSLSGNILLTDYLRWIWIRDGEAKEARLCTQAELEDRRFTLRDEHIAEVASQLRGFFRQAPKGVGRAEDLALELAARCRLLRDDLGAELVRQQKDEEGGKLLGLYDVFRKQVFAELTLAEFADAFAQTLGYGLFLAKFNAKPDDEIDLHNVKQFVPRTFELIRELVDFLDELTSARYAGAKWVIEEMLSLVNALDLATLKEDLSFTRRTVRRGVRARSEDEARLFERDPYVYFYEDFLAHYDPATRESRGVYYTPPPVVNFIVRAVDDLLVELFGIPDGLADRKRVTVLDFACGTGTFLLEVFQRVFDRLGKSSGKADPMVREHLLKNVFGFEFLIAPYTIAHLKLSQYFEEKKHALKDGERLQVFLTNTLEPVAAQPNMLVPALSAEAEHAQGVKDSPILVITGNPPYSGHSRNKGDWITGLIRDYSKEFPELQKPGQGKWLQDDYVKFMRFAQWKIDQVDEGVVAIITNHSFLDNPTFRGMRHSLMRTFDQIRVLDLHGNAKKKERAPDGGPDENVFDIQQGVAISLFVKKRDMPDERKGVWRADLWGERLEKYQTLAGSAASAFAWRRIEPAAPNHFFTPFNAGLWKRYEAFPSLPAIFAPGGDPAPGIVTTHDEFAISYSPEEAIEKVERLLATDNEAEARALFRLCGQSQWNYDTAKDELPKTGWRDKVTPVLYRPFDGRWTVWDRHVAVHRRDRSTRHLLNDNLGIATVRQIKSSRLWNHALATQGVIESTFISNRTSEICYAFPIYLYPDGGESGRIENLAPEFRRWLDARYDWHYEPEEILGCIYAVLYAPSYRTRYAEFLRMDFPRAPFPEKAEDFEALSRLGVHLIQAHLMRTIPRLGLGDFRGEGEREIDGLRYQPPGEDETGKIWINRDQYFDNTPPAVWDFQIGGYAVPGKYLKDRKGRTLTLDEVDAVENIINIAAFTLDQMSRIDAAYAAAFPEESAA